MTVRAYIGFGANLGEPEKKFGEAVSALSDLPETSIAVCSKLYETEPVGIVDHGPRFINAVIGIDTELTIHELAIALRKTEIRLGKALLHRSDLSRMIDLDLLLYGDQRICEEDLVVPHPRMDRRAFVLIPLAEVAPHAPHPVRGCDIATLLELLASKDLDDVRPVRDYSD